MSAVTAIKEKLPNLPSLGWFGGLMKREFIDHKIGFFWAPLFLAALMAIGILWGVSFGDAQIGNWDLDDIHISSDRGIVVDHMEYGIDKLNEMDLRSLRRALGLAMLALSFPILMIIPFVVGFGLLNCLYDDRKDRSYLFWKSMPVSDTKEVLSKLFAISVVGPAIIILIAAVVQVFAQIVGGIYLSVQGVEGIWSFIWSNVPTVDLAFGMIANIIVLNIWALPIIGWFLLVSSWAPRVPWLLAPAAIGVTTAFEAMFNQSTYFIEWVARRLSGWAFQMNDDYDVEAYGISSHNEGPFFMDAWDKLAAGFSSGEFWASTALGVGLIAGAIYFRRHRM